MRFLFLIILLSLVNDLGAQRRTENVFLITLDGLRWEELFGGAADSLVQDKTYVRNPEALMQQFGAPTAMQRREKLMPFFWTTIAEEGLLYGNQWKDNKVNCANPYWFSYPGYNEILTGYPDQKIDSNDKIPNSNITVLEWLNEQKGFRGRVAAFASWDVFPFIINEERSGVPVNAGFEGAVGPELTDRELFLNELQPTVPSPWSSVRLDAFTHHYAVEYIKKYHPRIVYIAYGETDDFAHDGAYDHYLKSAHQTDQWIAELWALVNEDPVYSGKTTFLITTDHGRGTSPKETWKSHGSNIEGAGAIWIAAIGPDTPALGEVTADQQHYQNQIARTLAALLGLNFESTHPVGGVIQGIISADRW